MIMTVQYNRSTKLWETWPDTISQEEANQQCKIVRYPAGETGKLAARLTNIEHAEPALAALTTALIQTAKRTLPEVDHMRAIKRIVSGAEIVLNAQVYYPRQIGESGSYLGEVGRVASSDPARGAYAIIDYRSAVPCGKYRRHLTCSCRDNSLGEIFYHHPERTEHYWSTTHRPAIPAHTAPYLRGIGIACKHVIAHVLAQQLADYPITFDPTPRPGRVRWTEPEPGDDDEQNQFIGPDETPAQVAYYYEADKERF
jgi:hypothetical protein